MGLRISTNVQSLAAQRNLGTNNMAQKASLEKLASGSRIVRAADDAAGLAISEKMRSQIRSVRQDVRNANDGISMIQTAEGGMNEISNILVRFRELSVQAASDTIGDTERQAVVGVQDRRIFRRAVRGNDGDGADIDGQILQRPDQTAAGLVIAKA